MRVVENILYYGGMIVAFIGILFLKDNLLLGVYMMLAGYVTMFIGWVLDAYEVGYADNL